MHALASMETSRARCWPRCCTQLQSFQIDSTNLIKRTIYGTTYSQKVAYFDSFIAQNCTVLCHNTRWTNRSCRWVHFQHLNSLANLLAFLLEKKKTSIGWWAGIKNKRMIEAVAKKEKQIEERTATETRQWPSSRRNGGKRVIKQTRRRKKLIWRNPARMVNKLTTHSTVIIYRSRFLVRKGARQRAKDGPWIVIFEFVTLHAFYLACLRYAVLKVIPSEIVHWRRLPIWLRSI